MLAISRKSVFAGSLCLGLIVAPWDFGRAEDNAPIPLRSGGRILWKKEEQAIGETCSAYREWIEVEGLPDAQAQRLINDSIRRELTVGKKLTQKDCSGGGDARFINGTTLGAARDRAIGVELSVYFGAKGIVDCAVFDLATGRRYDLERFLTPTGKALVAQRYCEAFLHEKGADFDQAYLSCGSYTAFESALNSGLRYCLGDSGVWALFGPANPVEGRGVLIADDEIERSFELPAGLELGREP